jgi:hypothetical protein
MNRRSKLNFQHLLPLEGTKLDLVNLEVVN